MKKLLVGFTGFVGSNLCEQTEFEGLYASCNITEAYGKCPELLVYSGVPAQKFLANSNPEADFEVIKGAIQNIEAINPKKIVLISTIDVFNDPNGKNEDASFEVSNEAYGKNRKYLEDWVMNHFEDYLIVRLPGLYGKNIKKNFIYDLIHYIPMLLKEEKYLELEQREHKLSSFYEKKDNGFYQCKELSGEEREELKQIFKSLNFSALNFTDSRGSFQFYNLKHLWEHINFALNNHINILHLATEPVTIAEIYNFIFGVPFQNEIATKIPNYNYKTKYDTMLGGKNGYIYLKKYVLEDIKNFVLEEESRLVKK